MANSFEVAIIGAGPAGLAAATNAAHRGLAHVLIERKEIGNTVYDYQKRKLVMAEPAKLPLRGHVPFQAGSREEVLAGWNEAVKAKAVNTLHGEVNGIKKVGEGFEIHSKAGLLCSAKFVILAIGVQGSPRTLGVSGDDLSHVAYTLSDPDEFSGRKVLVVGAGDAAIENALALADRNSVSLLNRTDDFPRAKEANAAKIMDAINSKKIKMYPNSETLSVEPGFVNIQTPDGNVRAECDHIIARLGCILPRKFLESCGIVFPNSNPDSVPVVNSRYESNVPGLFILGALIGYPLIKQAMNQGYEVIEHIIGNNVEPADQGLLAERLQSLPGDTNENLARIRDALPLFKDLSDPQFRELIIDSTVWVRKPGEVVFERNDYTDSFFSVVSGSVEIALPNGGTVPVTHGNFFGEMGLISGRRRTATVRVATDAVLLESPRKQILKLIASVSTVKQQLDQSFIRRALETTVFPDANPEFLRVLATKAKIKIFKKGEQLFKEGDAGDVLYMIRKGSVKISRRSRSGADVTQTYLPAGNIVGEMALLSVETKPRSATVSALVPTEAVMIDKADFLELLNTNPVVRERLTALARRRELENVTAAVNQEQSSVLDFVMAQGVTDADNFLMINSDLCIGCDNCEQACASTHQGYSRLDRKGGKSFASVQIPISCRHCENPLCMIDCPPDALTRQPNGEVVIRDSCIGCGNCVRNCPYGVIQMVYDNHEADPGFSLLGLLGISLSKKKKEKGRAKAGKCDMCSTLPGGPACVRSCPTGAAMRVNPSQLLRVLSNSDTHELGTVFGGSK
jgi:CRP-like cAMP-binding protein/thioredoxin reductase/Fe-S-cluster-containing hydrogenase component 2